ncbi:hypothetical protein KIK84_01995 [Curvibacter sp. CHRR-16]|uniref:hypothetical protein n=1 Tax=Curvibacter sp. CHRR-16 TaxID=2835872 RepID=UPI001BDA2FA2|nr:hypothetical protein [Curvibacter sp. CHRR-16]MBT0569087.1 hypothetical protein [Curvibacter sp. CHRR-16]
MARRTIANTLSSIGLIQNIENHNLLGTLSSINGLSNQAVDAALNPYLLPKVGSSMNESMWRQAA